MTETSDLIGLLRKMGHDMRVPLNTLISTTDMLVQGAYDPLTPKQERAASRLQRNSYRLLAILDDFMTYVKADANDLPLRPEPFDPRLQLTEWCTDVRPTLEGKGLTLNITTAQDVPATITADASFLKRMVQALLWNSAAYTSQGMINLTSTLTPERQWLICVQDSGAGIAADEVPQIFEPFWRGVERPQFPTAGAGLGLPMSLALAKLMGGNLFLKETSTQGSTFCIEVPLVTEPAPAAS